MKSWGIRSRVLFIALAPAAVIGAVLAVYFTHVQVRGLDRALADRGRGLVHQLAPAAEFGVVTANTTILRKLATAMLGEPDVVAVRFTAADGRELLSLAHARPEEAEPPLTFRAPITQSELPVSDFGEDAGQGSARVIGWAEIDVSHAATGRAQRQAIVSGLGITLLGLGLSALLALRTGAGVIRPILRLTGAVQDIGRGQLGTRVQTDSAAELHTLETGINRMAASLEAMHQDLQAGIDQATDELRTALRELELRNAQLEEARARAAEASRIKTEFLSNISHEIRTPMNAITGFANLLLKTQLDAEQREYAQTVRASADSLLTKINDILDFSRIAAGEISLERVPFNLRDVVDEAMAISAPAAYDKNLELVLLFYTDVPEHLIGDPVRVRQVLMNLLGNAIKFTQRGRVTVRVMLERETDEAAQVRISVQDTGIGLSRADQNKLFSAFGQADTSATREFGGVGIGLVVCRKLVEKMEGNIGLESRQGEGSTFWFTCRCARQDQPGHAGGDLALTGHRALVFERDELAAAGLLAQLQRWGVRVQTLGHLDDLPAVLERHPPTAAQPVAVFVGLGRDELDDGHVAETVARACRPHCRVVVLASTVNRGVLEGMERHGAALALPKVARRRELYEGLVRLWNGPGESVETAGAEPLGALHILVVDDHPINRKLVRTLYERTGARVDEAESGEQAVRMARATDYDLIYMDIQMPGMTGIEAAEQIRAARHHRRTPPIIAVTAGTLEGERDRLIRAGLDDCAVKPLQEDELWTLTRKWVAPEKLGALGGSVGPPGSGPTTAVKPDRSQALRIAGGNAQLADELFAMLVAELPEARERLHTALSRLDVQAVQSEAHKLHGAASYCAVEPLRRAAAALERSAQAGKRADMERYMRELDAAIARLLEDAVAAPN